MQVQPLAREDPMEEEMAAHSSHLAWKIPWAENPGRQQPGGFKESDATEQARMRQKLESCSRGLLATTRNWEKVRRGRGLHDTLILAFYSQNCDKVNLFFEATQFVVTCDSSSRKLMHARTSKIFFTTFFLRHFENS